MNYLRAEPSFEKYLNAPEEQMALLEAEGLSFEKKGKKCVYWVVKRWEFNT